MYSRIELQAKLEEILGSDQVHYQPPASLLMTYPAIVYAREDIANTFANNNVYKQKNTFTVTLLDKNQDSQYVKPISMLPTCRFSRQYVADNIYHDVFLITLH